MFSRWGKVGGIALGVVWVDIQEVQEFLKQRGQGKRAWGGGGVTSQTVPTATAT